MPWSPVPSGTERVQDHGGGSDQRGLRAGSARYIWVKRSRRKRVNRTKIATYNVKSLLRDEHIKEFEEERKETGLVWDVIGIGEVRRPEECFTIFFKAPTYYTLIRQISAKQEYAFS